MLCPVDKTEMHRVKIIAHYGQPIELDQCESCGGIWFDEAELFRAKQGEAEKIEVLNTDILKNPSMIENSTLICPRDQTVLHRFTDRYFPKDIILARCPTCKGIWLNRGLFTKYQRFRQELKRQKEKSPEDKKLEESVNQLIATYQSEHSTETLRRLGEFLSTPSEPGNILSPPLYGDTSIFPVPSQRAPLAGSTASVALNTIMMILRAFIPF